MKVTNPATGDVLVDVYEDTPGTLDDKYHRAREYQGSWGALELEHRVAAITSFRSEVVARAEELAQTLTAETGKPITQSRRELEGLLPRIDFFVENAPRVLAPETVEQSGEITELISHEPLGAIASISAWNYPYFVGSNVFLPALLAGNSVVYKPSEHATLTGIAITEMLHTAGVARDAFVLAMGAGDVGHALLQHPFDGVFFTGSYGTGRRIAEEVSSRLTKVQLELGGKDPVYVTDDVDVATAATGLADGAFYNNGQSCCAVERLYVHDLVYEEFVDAFTAEVEGFVVGDPTDPETYIGPLTRPQQADLLEIQVADARHNGADVTTGGRRLPGPGTWFEPTVVIDATHEMEVMRAESFGPIIGVQRVTGDDEAIYLMNDTPYGLTAGVYSTDRERAEHLLRQVDAGSVYWNCCDRVSPRLPWSGRGHSGLGCTLSTYGILTFAQPKAWHLRRPA